MGLADHNGLDGLKALCQSTLIRGVDVSNVCTLYRAAHLHEVTPVLCSSHIAYSPLLAPRPPS